MSLEKSFPIYKKVHASGNVGWRVDMGKLNGKRTFKSFPTEAAAKRHQVRCLEAQAKQRPVDLHDLTESTRHEVLAALAKLRAHNVTITQAVEFYLQHARPANANATISEVMKQFRRAKMKAGMSKKYIETSSASFFVPFRDHFKDCLMSALTTEECEAYIYKSKSWSVTTRRAHIRHLGVLCNFAVERGFLGYSPLKKVEVPKKPPSTSRHRVASVDNVIKILQHALRHEYKPECAALVLILFCGVRTEEIAKIKWVDIKLDEDEPAVHLYDNITKAGKTRINIIPDNALDWLRLLRATGRIVPSNYEGRMRYIRRMAKAGFKQNTARISFASYHLARHEDAIKTAFMLGHDNPTLLYNTYKALVTKAEAERYWKITPGYDGVDQIITPSDAELEQARMGGILRGLKGV